MEQAGLKVTFWRDDTEPVVDWLQAVTGGSPPGGLNLSVLMGPDFPALTSNLARNIRENRLGVLSAVLSRD